MGTFLTFRRMATIGAILAALLASALTALPEIFFWMWQLEPSSAAAFLGRRTGALFAAFAVILFLVRSHAPSPTRAALAAGFAVGCVWLAVLGVVEYFAGAVGPGIALAVVVELVVAAGFARFAR